MDFTFDYCTLSQLSAVAAGQPEWCHFRIRICNHFEASALIRKTIKIEDDAAIKE